MAYKWDDVKDWLVDNVGQGWVDNIQLLDLVIKYVDPDDLEEYFQDCLVADKFYEELEEEEDGLG